MRTLLVVAVLLAGCGESRSRTREMCGKVRDLCGAEAVTECPTDRDLADAEKRLGKKPVGNYLACMEAATSCLQIVGCVDGLGLDAADELAGGRERGGRQSEGAAVRYVDVSAATTVDDFGDHEMTVTIEVEAITDFSGSPSVKVTARCEGAVVEKEAFFMELDRLRKGQRRVDTVTFDDLAGAPRQCELVLSMVDGATNPERFCFQGGKTHPGPCG